jgi:hypothetical protein
VDIIQTYSDGRRRVRFKTVAADRTPQAMAEMIEGANKYLRPIPGVLQFHAGRMVPSHPDGWGPAPARKKAARYRAASGRIKSA